MKNKYERMNRLEKKELYREYKKDKQVFVKKLEKMFLLCYFGVGYGIIAFIYDFFFKKSTLSFVLDIVVVVFSIFCLLKVYFTKKDLLNKYAIKKDKEYKKDILKKYQK